MKWAILVIYYSTNVSGIGDLQTHVAFPSYKQCGQAMMPILDVVRHTYPDAWAHCKRRARCRRLQDRSHGQRGWGDTVMLLTSIKWSLVISWY
jgi:hypothetical protein